MTATPIKQVQVGAVRRRAGRAIARRLGHGANAILSVERDPDRPNAVLLHVNSGGNAIACETALREAGYRVEATDYNPWAAGNYGVKLRVLAGVS